MDQMTKLRIGFFLIVALLFVAVTAIEAQPVPVVVEEVPGFFIPDTETGAVYNLFFVTYAQDTMITMYHDKVTSAQEALLESYNKLLREEISLAHFQTAFQLFIQTLSMADMMFHEQEQEIVDYNSQTMFYFSPMITTYLESQ